MSSINNIQITVVGLGYVGLPLAVEFGKKYSTLGFDINKSRVDELRNGIDRTKEISIEELNAAKNLSFTIEVNDLKPIKNQSKTVFIVTVPTPIDSFKKPDLRPLISASSMIGQVLKKGDIVIYESTVYPGCTEDDCIPVLEKFSGLKFNEDFYCGYSPERINPGDRINTLTKILKITSGSTPEVAEFVDNLYKSIITVGTYKATSIKVAEAAKIIENCQRDVNISFVNELALIFDRMGIDTTEVLEAAGTKWNFLKFKPGLVGGHCIGVDPYYMIHKAEALGYYPAVIGAGRRINDNMGIYVANNLIKLMIKNGLSIKDSKVLILGFTFKENCPDTRNSRVIDIFKELTEFGCQVEVEDSWANREEVKEEYGVTLKNGKDFDQYAGIILAVSHKIFLQTEILDKLKVFKGVIYDVKSILPKSIISNRL